jgi:hypothetical protein
MSYTHKSFQSCQFNPLSTERMTAAFPILLLAIEKEWADDPHIDTLIRYVIMVYDPKSPMVTDERDIARRKQLALDELKMSDEELRQQWIAHDHPFLAELITELLKRFVKSREYAILVALEFKFWEAIKLTMQPISGKNSKEELESLQKKSLVADEMDKDIKRIDQYYKQFFMEDAELEKKGKRRLSPETIAGLK